MKLQPDLRASVIVKLALALGMRPGRFLDLMVSHDRRQWPRPRSDSKHWDLELAIESPIFVPRYKSGAILKPDGKTRS